MQLSDNIQKNWYILKILYLKLTGYLFWTNIIIGV